MPFPQQEPNLVQHIRAGFAAQERAFDTRVIQNAAAVGKVLQELHGRVSEVADNQARHEDILERAAEERAAHAAAAATAGCVQAKALKSDMDALAERVATLKADFGVVVK